MLYKLFFNAIRGGLRPPPWWVLIAFLDYLYTIFIVQIVFFTVSDHAWTILRPFFNNCWTIRGANPTNPPTPFFNNFGGPVNCPLSISL